jgi:hypothetical protein
MKIETPDEETICHYCHQKFNGIEEAWVNPLPNGEESHYHLRCAGKLFVYRIEGVLPKHLFNAVIKELNEPLPEELKVKDKGQTTLDEFGEEE